MPKAKRYTEKRFVMLTPAQARQLERLSRHHEVSVPELIRTATRRRQTIRPTPQRHFGYPLCRRPRVLEFYQDSFGWSFPFE